ncbi:SMP-30/gluconolactonase/LRE family protein [Bordetella sp. BOR01]|uniref:SMP-30/gluconolactonase/LRE family protein n=1 Tax=Bordetella sp. BOR01 TaxID=2854779 RepID=UPI001C456EC2|nr:SMP-30/gluconolactonase/LRE family protein [Bordetella sp. BOR01]MBV7482285.1 SMP-30/gluconolactonase/LRE family protein [Bordetella sp. BOR01]
MWNLSFEPPQVVQARVLATLPDALRLRRASDWAHANKPGQVVDSFLEGPAFDRAGNLYLTDIAHGRIFRLTPAGQWQAVAETGGWPNGIAIDRDGDLWVADYRRGLLRVRPAEGNVEVMLGHRNSESFKGLNDLHFDLRGNLYFTDQGQTGLHDPSGRVYRLRPSGQLDLLLANGPSPNGVALDPAGQVLYMAMTRANAVWRAPLLADGSLSKVGAFRTFFGASGPDGLAVDAKGRLVVAHASLGGAFVLNARGEVTHFVRSPAGSTVTNLAFQPETSTLVMTESQTGTVLHATLPDIGAPLWSHADAAGH